MESPIHSVWDFVLRNIGIIGLISSLALTIILYSLQQRRDRTKLRVEGRQHFSKARSLYRQATTPGSLSLDKEDVYEEVVHLCGDALDLGYRKGEVHYLRGQSLIELGRRGEALRSFQAAARCDPSSVIFRYGLALAYFDLNNIEVAIREFESVLRMSPKDDKELYHHDNAREWLKDLAKRSES